jgi:hypothetical protein
MLRAELIERGHDVVGHIRLSDALAVLRQGAGPRPQVILLELRGQELSMRDLCELSQSGIPTIILGGAIELNDPLIQRFRWTEILKRPVTIGEIADQVEKRAAFTKT